MNSLCSRRDAAVLGALLAAGSYALAVGRSHFDTVAPAAIEIGAPRQLARELVGRNLQALCEDDRVRVDHFLTSLCGDGVGADAEKGAFHSMWLKPCVRGRTRWLLAERCTTQVRLHQFDSDWGLVATTRVDRTTTRALWHSPNVELVTTPLSPIVVVTAQVSGIEPDRDVVRRACLGLDDDGAFVLRYEDEAGRLAVGERRWAATSNGRPDFTSASWLRALMSDDPLDVLCALNRSPRGGSGDDAEAAAGWQRVADAAEPRLRQLAESQCAWIREAATDLRGRLR